MQDSKFRILVVDDNPLRLSAVATALILRRFSVLPVNSCELSRILSGNRDDWKADLVLLGSTLDGANEGLIGKTFRNTPIQRLSPVAMFDLNLPDLVNRVCGQKNVGPDRSGCHSSSSVQPAEVSSISDDRNV
jgi:hypothetical protein